MAVERKARRDSLAALFGSGQVAEDPAAPADAGAPPAEGGAVIEVGGERIRLSLPEGFQPRHEDH